MTTFTALPTVSVANFISEANLLIEIFGSAVILAFGVMDKLLSPLWLSTTVRLSLLRSTVEVILLDVRTFTINSRTNTYINIRLIFIFLLVFTNFIQKTPSYILRVSHYLPQTKIITK